MNKIPQIIEIKAVLAINILRFCDFKICVFSCEIKLSLIVIKAPQKPVSIKKISQYNRKCFHRSFMRLIYYSQTSSFLQKNNYSIKSSTGDTGKFCQCA
jgi:hypothetical protein